MLRTGGICSEASDEQGHLLSLQEHSALCKTCPEKTMEKGRIHAQLSNNNVEIEESKDELGYSFHHNLEGL